MNYGVYNCFGYRAFLRKISKKLSGYQRCLQTSPTCKVSDKLVWNCGKYERLEFYCSLSDSAVYGVIQLKTLGHCIGHFVIKSNHLRFAYLWSFLASFTIPWFSKKKRFRGEIRLGSVLSGVKVTSFVRWGISLLLWTTVQQFVVKSGWRARAAS